MPSKFTRKEEDFTCLRCRTKVRGTGYTNHCPECLWSRHVDVNPGDRAAPCKGPMAPLRVEQKSGSYVLVHRCETCGLERKNKTAKDDNFEALLQLAAERQYKSP